MLRRGRTRRRSAATPEQLESRQLLTAVVTEFMADNVSGLTDEDGEFADWIEIHNPAAEPLSLNNWYLTDDADALTRWQFPDVQLEAGEYRVVFASGKNRTGAQGPLHTDFRLDRGGEFLALVRPDGQTVEQSFAPAYPAQIADVSYGLSSDGGQQGFFPVPTPGAVNGQPPVDDPLRTLVINEIMYHPSSERVADEFVELYNRGNQAVSLLGWRMSGGIDFDFPDRTLAAGEYLVVAADVDSFRSTYGDQPDVVGPWTGQLSNSSDTVTLRNAADSRVDRVVYADEGEWAQRARGPDDRGTQGWVWLDDHDGGGKSLELVNPSMPNEFGQNWTASASGLGSPGRANSGAATDIAPLITDPEYGPVIPGSTDPVTVSARVIDEGDAALGVFLNWRVDGEADFNQLVMRDDGQNGDSFAGDQVFVATIPAHADLTIIEFYVEASDPGALVRTWPAPTADSGQVTNALYQVLDSFDLSAGWQPDSHPVYFEVMTAAEQAEFTSINRFSNAQMNATFISANNDGVKVRHNAGVRIRGSGSRNANPPNNRINIPSDNPWEGVTAINLNVTSIQDQIAGSALFRLAGLSTGNAKAVRLISNGVNLMMEVRGTAFYAHVETLNSEFAENHYPDDSGGNLYKGRRPNESPPGGLGAGLVYNGPEPEPYSSYTKLTNASQADWSDVIHLTDVLNNTPDDTYLEQVAEVVDIDQWLRHMGFHALLGNTEGGLVNGDRLGDDYAMYRGVEDTRFKMVSHDLDSLFSGVTRGILNATNVPALRRLMLHPEIRQRYYLHLKDMIGNVLLTGDARVALEESLRGVQTPNQISSIVNFLQDRADYVLSVIPEAVRFESFLPTQQGLRVSDRAYAELHGVADLHAQSVLVNGQLANFDDFNNWQLGSSVITGLPRSVWSYLEDGSDPGSDWNEPGFVPDAAWKSGEAQLGYGDNDERTLLDFGDDPDNKPITTYFRHEWEVPDASRWLTLTVQLLRDDGAVVYINGTEVVRSNLPNGEEITDQTLAGNNVAGSNERRFFNFEVDPSVLRDGTNVIAVEVHQVAPDSADISFDLRMRGRFLQNSGIPLHPGVNRLTVQAMSGPNGTGDVLASEFADVLYDDGSVQRITADLPAGQTVWQAVQGPYQVEGTVTVPEGASLVIEPGTSVYFSQDATLVVNGELTAEGTVAQRIRFTSIPGLPFVPDIEGLPDGPARWDGIHFVNSTAESNIIAYADIEYAQDGEGSIGVDASALLVDNVTVSGTHRRMIFGSNASLTVSNSVFPDMFAENENPAQLGLDNVSEHIKITGRTPAGGQLLIQGNHFGSNRGHNDVIDADSNRVTQGPILQIIDNVFNGAGDELLDLGGDVYVAGNLFRGVFKDDFTSDRGYASAISTGDAGANTTVVVARNVFYDVDHAINLKNNAATIFENNTVVTVHPDFDDRFGNPNVGSAINLFVDEPGARPGLGAYAAGNIFWDAPRVFGNADLPDDRVSHLQLFDNLLSESLAKTSVAGRPGNVLALGSGNQTGDPRLTGPEEGDFQLRPGSAAANGIQSHDHGAMVPGGVWISGEPASVTHDRNASLVVGGPGIFAYQFRVNGGPWSEVLPVGDGFDIAGTVRTGQIDVQNLPDGSYTIEVIGQDFAGNWQTEPTVSRTWTVQGQHSSLVISEVLASNRTALRHFGALPDMIELYNAGTDPVNLAGYSLTDSLDVPGKFVFGPDQVIQPGQYLRLFADDNQTPGLHIGFSLRREGEAVYLHAPQQAGQTPLVDAIEFGIQIPDFSIGRVGPDLAWALTVPTFGTANRAARVGDPGFLAINEWLADSDTSDDFVELYNPDSLPVELGGLALSDAVDGSPRLHQISPFSYIAGQGFASFQADGDVQRGADHLGFRLSLDQEALGLVDQQLRLIDAIAYQPQTRGFSQGRIPDGASSLAFFDLPSPGWANGAGFQGDLSQDGVVDVADIELLCAAIRAGADATTALDLDRDGQVTLGDLRFIVETVLSTTFGDANLDGAFDSSDFVAIFVAGEYEDDLPGNSTWAEGDWDCDGDFTSSDLIVAFQAGAYAADAQAAIAVPPPPLRTDQLAAASGEHAPSEISFGDSQTAKAAVLKQPDRPGLTELVIGGRDELFAQTDFPVVHTDDQALTELAIGQLADEDRQI